MIRASMILFALLLPLLGQVALTGTILDPSNAPVPSVILTLKSNGRELTALTSTIGQFRFETQAPGNYELRATVPGFDPIRQTGKLGAAPLTIRLTLASVKGAVDVPERERVLTTAAGNNADAISVERTMLDNLPMLDLNYIAALSRFLDPGGSGTSIIVDGMEMRSAGVTASAIQEIRINNNPYTVEYPRWSRRRIEIITKSSADAFHGTVNFLLRDYRLNARDAFAVQRPQEERRILEGSLFGPAGNGKKTSFLLSAARENENLIAVVFAQGPQGPIIQNVPTPQINSVASLRISRQFNDTVPRREHEPQRDL